MILVIDGTCIEKSVNAIIGGVGMLFSFCVLKSFNSIERIHLMVTPEQQSFLITVPLMLVMK